MIPETVEIHFFHLSSSFTLFVWPFFPFILHFVLTSANIGTHYKQKLMWKEKKALETTPIEVNILRLFVEIDDKVNHKKVSSFEKLAPIFQNWTVSSFNNRKSPEMGVTEITFQLMEQIRFDHWFGKSTIVWLKRIFSDFTLVSCALTEIRLLYE